MNFHSSSSIRYNLTLFENYIPKCNIVKRILISFSCFSEYIIPNLLFLKKRQNFKLSHAANYRWRFNTADNLSNAKPAVQQRHPGINFRFRKEDPQKVNKQRVLAFESL